MLEEVKHTMAPIQMVDDSHETPVGPSQSDSKRQGLISINNLNYILEPDLSVATNCTYKNHFFQQNRYLPNQQSICIVNSGADYIDTRRSYLRFELKVIGTDVGESGEVNFLGGSALNLIDNITISSRSGDELARIRKTNLWSSTVHPYRHCREWMDTVGQGALFNHDFDATITSAVADTETVCIPMYLLSDFFNQAKLMPSMLMSGLRIEIQWANAASAFSAENFPVTYEINDIFFSLKSVQLTDATQRALNEMSAVNGLEIVYCDWENTEQQQATNQFHIEVRKASSRALKAFVKVRLTAELGSTQNNMLSQVNDIVKYQWQLGSLYFPQQPINGKEPDQINTESYFQVLDAHDKLQPSSIAPFVGLKRPLGTSDIPEDTYAGGRGVYGVTLERSTLFNFAGVPINNSRVLAFRASFKGETEKNVNIFLKYVKLARVFLNNVEVEQ